MNRIIIATPRNMKQFFFILTMSGMIFLPQVSWGIGPYSVNGTTVEDQATGLIWQQQTADTNDDNQLTDADKVGWRQALAYCEDLSLGSRDDWRLPNIRELRSIVDTTTSAPAIHSVFQSQSFAHWSSTTSKYNQDSAWFVDFFYGNNSWRPKTDDDPNNDPDYSAFVRCVRGGIPASFSWTLFLPALINTK